jgi:cytochrome c biogenesis protein CcdA
MFLLFALLVLLAQPVNSAKQVTIDFVYWYPIDSPCPACVQDIIIDCDFKNFSLTKIQSDYGNEVVINRIDYYTEQGTALRQLYQITAPNSLVIKSDEGSYTKLEMIYNATYENITRQIIDVYLAESPPQNKGLLECYAQVNSEVVAADIYILENDYFNRTPFADFFDPGNYTINATWNEVTQSKTVTITNGTKTSITFLFDATSLDQDRLIVALAAAFTVGFFETFSPCLIALLSFVLSYAVGEKNQFRGSMSKVVFFAVGFLAAALLLATATLMMLSSVAQFYDVMMWGVCIIGLFFGLDLLGLDFRRLLRINIKTKPLIGNLTRKYTLTLAGLGLLGFLFYFLDPCLAPVLVVAHITKFPGYAAPSLFVFALGVLVPFVVIGMLAGSLSKLVRSTYRHRAIIRAISGMILIGYSIWIMYGLCTTLV